MKKLLPILVIIVSTLVQARPSVDTMRICYGVRHGQQTFKEPCMVTDTGGAGVSALIYKIRGVEYTIEQSGEEDTLNGKTYKTYLRDAFFEKIAEPSEDTKPSEDSVFFCYRTDDHKIEFCSKQEAREVWQEAREE